MRKVKITRKPKIETMIEVTKKDFIENLEKQVKKTLSVSGADEIFIEGIKDENEIIGYIASSEEYCLEIRNGKIKFNSAFPENFAPDIWFVNKHYAKKNFSQIENI